MTAKPDAYLLSIHLTELKSFYTNSRHALRIQSLFSNELTLEGKTLQDGHLHTLRFTEWTSKLAALQDLLQVSNKSPKLFRFLLQPGSCVLDIYINPTAAKKYWSSLGCLPCEVQLETLFRAANDALLYDPKTEDGIAQHLSSSPKSQVESVCPISVSEVAVRDAGGNWNPWTLHSTPTRVPNLSVVVLPYGASMTEALDSIQKLPVPSVDLAPFQPCISLECVLLLDATACRRDTRLFTLRYLQSQSCLRLHPDDYDQWSCSDLLDDTGDRAHLSLRTHLKRSELNPNLLIPKEAIVWTSVIVDERPHRSRYLLPKCHRLYVVQRQDALAFAESKLNASEVSQILRALCFPSLWSSPELYSAVEQKSFRVDSTCRGFRIQLEVSACKAFEKPLLVSSKMMGLCMALHALLPKSDGSFSHKQYMYHVCKHGTTLDASHLERCLEGFHLESGKTLADPQRPLCSVCYTNSVEAMLDSCGHMFCKSCLTGCLQANNSVLTLRPSAPCPTCRAVFHESEWTVVTRMSARHHSKEPPKLSKEIHLQRLANEARAPTVTKEDECKDSSSPKADAPANVPLVITPYKTTLSVLKEWLPDCECVALDTGSLEQWKAEHRRSVILTSPLFQGVKQLKMLHQLLQLSCTADTTVYVLAARNWEEDEGTALADTLSKQYGGIRYSSRYLEKD